MKSNNFKKVGVVLFLFFFSAFILTACNKKKSIILFNDSPITKQNLLDNPNEFSVDKKIYYIFISEKPLKTNMIRVRIAKRDSKAENQPTKLAYSNDFKLRKDQIYYYDDYIVMHETGTYCMIVYSLDNLKIPLSVADFKVK